ncbi:hypothetical protein WICPIJ_001569 [Wickerhamomyces pijperi]|uniref:Uncharacterized protein n=1 Tax=Wickerhamomyces pijperi TaxID=599730 RepID=A0A9P8QDI8_WICPI|nr:hypothetical protein WICPIJ_001569 [Wickerhamomyces pijperi]
MDVSILLRVSVTWLSPDLRPSQTNSVDDSATSSLPGVQQDVRIRLVHVHERTIDLRVPGFPRPTFEPLALTQQPAFFGNVHVHFVQQVDNVLRHEPRHPVGHLDGVLSALAKATYRIGEIGVGVCAAESPPKFNRLGLFFNCSVLVKLFWLTVDVEDARDSDCLIACLGEGEGDGVLFRLETRPLLYCAELLADGLGCLRGVLLAESELFSERATIDSGDLRYVDSGEELVFSISARVESQSMWLSMMERTGVDKCDLLMSSSEDSLSESKAPPRMSSVVSMISGALALASNASSSGKLGFSSCCV